MLSKHICLIVIIHLSIFFSNSIGDETIKTVCRHEQLIDVDGSWIFVNEMSKKSFRCCGYDFNDHNDEALKGFCTNETLLTGGRGCYCDEIQGHRHTVSDREKYVWTPNNCSLLPFNAALFCDVLGDRKILLIGIEYLYSKYGIDD